MTMITGGDGGNFFQTVVIFCLTAVIIASLQRWWLEVVCGWSIKKMREEVMAGDDDEILNE